VPSRSGPARLARLLGDRIRTLRTQAGLTQEQVAWDCDMTKAHLSQIESGKGFASVPILHLLAKRLGVSLADVVAGAPDDPTTQLLDSVRAKDAEGAVRALRALGLRVRTTGESPRRRHGVR
jgi:transcriptional regulator with XRE-family HTH domain